MKKNRRTIKMGNAIDPATTTAKNWGFIPVAGKGGKTTNFAIPPELFKRELEEYLNGGAVNA
jgi:hypothetical protein